jgi:hypothetical protein
MLCLIIPQTALAKRIRTWHDVLEEYKTIKIYVSDIKNSAGDDDIKVIELKTGITKALKARLSTDFEIVTDQEKAIVILNSDIIEYYWTLEDPLDQIHSSAGIAKDILVKEPYVRMTIDFKLLYAPAHRLIWEKSVKATITDKDMTEEKSYSIINERMVTIFMRNLFKKNRASRFRVHGI